MRVTVQAVVAAVVLAAGACRGGDRPADAEARWVGTWGTSPQLTEPANLPPAPGLSGNTLRQIVHVSLGGERLRVSFSNAFGTTPVVIRRADIAVAEGASAIDTATDVRLSFAGDSSVTLPAGAAATSDPISFALAPLSNVAITIHFDSTSAAVTGHPGSRTTSYVQTGDAVTAPSLPDAATTDHWYILTGIDIATTDSAAAVVTLGNSITDGRGSGTNENNRWPDDLARRLQANPATSRVAVLNEAIGGNCVLRDCLGPAAVDRFQRDVLDQSGVRWLIILEGVNDIGTSAEADSTTVADSLIAAYQRMIDLAHARNIKVYGATITPFGESFYDSPGHQTAWRRVNQWIRESGEFDAVIDLAAVMADPDVPSRMRADGDDGDHLHPSEAGHQMIADAIDLTLFE